jgi:EamA-like transporter family
VQFLNEHGARRGSSVQSAARFPLGLIARPWSGSGGIDVAGVGYMIAGSLSVGCSFVYARRFISPLNLPAAALTTYQIGVAIIVLLMVTNLDGIDAVFYEKRAWIGLILGLGLCGTGLAYLAYYYVVASLGAVAASGVTYIPPVVALLIGALLVGDAPRRMIDECPQGSSWNRGSRPSCSHGERRPLMRCAQWEVCASSRYFAAPQQSFVVWRSYADEEGRKFFPSNAARPEPDGG